MSMGKSIVWEYRSTDGWKVHITIGELIKQSLCARRFSFLDLKEYSDAIDDDDDTQQEMVNGMHVSVDYEDSGADTTAVVNCLKKYNWQKWMWKQLGGWVKNNN